MECGDSHQVTTFIRETKGGYDCLCFAAEDVSALPRGVCGEDRWYAYTPSAEDLYTTGAQKVQEISDSIKENETPLQPEVPFSDDMDDKHQVYKRRSRVMGLCDEGLRPCNIPGKDGRYHVGRIRR